MRVSAPAKINLHLRVGRPTPDGFHPLLSWMATVGLFDTLSFQAIEGSAGDTAEVSLACDDPAVPCDGSNLVVRAAEAVLREAGRADTRLAVSLAKRIPMGAGLGGGSSDAAATVRAVARLLGLDWPPEKLARIAAILGSDVAFFLHGPSSQCTGRGEVVVPIARPKPTSAVLILPAIHMATPAVYRQFDRMGLGSDAALHRLPDWAAWAALGAEALAGELVNDLEAPAFALSADLRDLHGRAARVLRRTVRMSGSGSSLFALYDAAGDADDAAARVGRDLGLQALPVALCPPQG